MKQHAVLNMPQIDIIEQDDDGGFDISNDEQEVLSSAAAQNISSSSSSSSSGRPTSSSSLSAPTSLSFVPSKTFIGSKKGMVFKTGAQGVGYYTDTLSKEFRDREAPPLLDDSVSMTLLHRRGEAAPHSVEVEVDITGCSAIATADDMKVEIKEDNMCVLSSEYWTEQLEIPLKYAVRSTQAQGWLHDGCMTLRLPILA